MDTLHDGSAVAGWVDSVTGNFWNFLSAGGSALPGSYTAAGTTTAWVPLVDENGSTIALVNPASPNSPPASTFRYNPSGQTTVGGQANNWPFRYQGMEQETTDFPSGIGLYNMYYGATANSTAVPCRAAPPAPARRAPAARAAGLDRGKEACHRLAQEEVPVRSIR
jgi:hypothetical protein